MDGFDRFKQAVDQKTAQDLSKKQYTDQQVMAIQTQETIVKSVKSLVEYLDNRTSKTQVVNQLREIGTPDALKVVSAVDSLHETLKTHKDTDLTELTGVVKELLDEARLIPKEHPEEKEEQFIDYTNQMTALLKAVQSVESVVKEQKLVAEAPIVNVPETQVNVEAPDLKPLQSSIKDVVDAVKDIVIPEYTTDNKEVEKLLKLSNKLLKELIDKPTSKGGGGGLATPYVDANGIPYFPVADTTGSLPVSLKQTATIRFATVSISSSGDNQIVAAVTGKKIKVLSATLVSSGTVSVKWRSGTTDLSGAMPLVANSGFVLPASSPGQGHYFETAVTTALNINLSGAVAVSGHISYYEE